MKNNVGKAGELAAQQYLKKLGYDILDVNFCNSTGSRIGEIDIIAQHNDEIVFVEVKTKTIRPYSQSLAEENITRSKLFKLDKIAKYYIQKNKLWNSPYRFDAVSVYLTDNNDLSSIKHLQNIYF